MSEQFTYCIYVSHLLCNPKKCALLKCPKVQASTGYPIEKLYELGVKERPRSEPQSNVGIPNNEG